MGGSASNGETPASHGLPDGGALNFPAPISVVCIGAGVSGIATAIRVQETMSNYEFDIYEKNEDLGGTWYENRYPGCACDVPGKSKSKRLPELTANSLSSSCLHLYFR